MNEQPPAFPSADGISLPLLTITGRVSAPITFSLADLQSMPQSDLDDQALVCGSGEPLGRTGRLRGVPLADIVNLAPVIVSEHNDTKKMYLVAQADDGYKTVFSWQELFNSDNGPGIVVLLERDGRPLGEGEARIDLISSRDHLSGPRYVKRLSRVDILMVA